ncbi:MAG: DUF2807 domain-containing protein [Candidatus Pseudobacter hemicellulosilyticus]|uniref:DUF2807 domain-containing protein n=1 Tax=Candidatus Pseudobacter hemicellulosilyticus TaxID=3121375 RepID=A0AAJ5WRK7_9BACT|nr:MAG: DUF2807 domain-containing protein [Pseudobacter sp.]
MKQQLTLIMLMTSMLFATAGKAAGGPSDTEKRYWVANAGYNSIVIRNNVNVVLIEDSSTLLSIEGPEQCTRNVELKVENNTLTISSKRAAAGRHITVYVPVRKLQRITVKGESQVKTIGILDSEKLHLRIEGECQINVLVRGRTTVDNDDEHSFGYLVHKRFSLRKKEYNASYDTADPDH